MPTTVKSLTAEEKIILWDALWSCERIRLLGAAHLGDPGYQHMGVDFWSKFPEETRPDDTKSRAALFQFIEAMVPYKQYHCPVCKTAQTRYHNVKDLRCRSGACVGYLVAGPLSGPVGTSVEDWIREHGHWDDHPDFPVKDWQREVLNEDTRLSYHDWLRQRADQKDEDTHQEA